MIVHFVDRATEDVFHGARTARVRRFPAEVVAMAQRKLDMIDAAHELLDLRAPPGNRLQALRGDRRGFHSIRVNDQRRIVFRWIGPDARDVSLQDYHS